MTLIPNEQQTEMLNQALKDLIMQDYFLIEKIKAYLSKERSEGKTEFRIIMQSENKITIHPLGKDGSTLDLTFQSPANYPDESPLPQSVQDAGEEKNKNLNCGLHIVERFADNGEHSHWELINHEGEVLWLSGTQKM